MTYSISLVLILAAMLFLGIVFLFISNKYARKLLQCIAIVLAFVGFYCHALAEVRGEYHAISLVLSEHIVGVVQHYANTSIGRILMRFVNYAHENDWIIYLISVIVVVLIGLMPSIIKNAKRHTKRFNHHF